MNPLPTPSTVGLDPHPVSALTARTVPVCGCGQDLDMVHGKHCPRCGVSLRHLSLAA